MLFVVSLHVLGYVFQVVKALPLVDIFSGVLAFLDFFYHQSDLLRLASASPFSAIHSSRASVASV